MADRIHIGAGDDKDKAVSRVENQLTKLKNRTAFEALNANQRNELVRETLVLVLRIVLRRLLK